MDRAIVWAEREPLTLTVPGRSGQYQAVVRRGDALRAGTAALNAVRFNCAWYFPDATGSVLTAEEDNICAYGAGIHDPRGVDFSAWLSDYATVVLEPPSAVVGLLAELISLSAASAIV